MVAFTSWKRALAFGLYASSGVQAVKLSANTQDLFDESMNFLDTIYDKAASYLNYFYYPLAAGPHETRSSVWYATGLLQRNKGDDVEQAIKIIKAVIGDQEKNKTLQWFGDYTVYPEQPTVGTDAYPASVGLPLLILISLTSLTSLTPSANTLFSRPDLQHMGSKLAWLHWYQSDRHLRGVLTPPSHRRPASHSREHVQQHHRRLLPRRRRRRRQPLPILLKPLPHARSCNRLDRP